MGGSDCNRDALCCKQCHLITLAKGGVLAFRVWLGFACMFSLMSFGGEERRKGDRNFAKRAS